MSGKRPMKMSNGLTNAARAFMRRRLVSMLVAVPLAAAAFAAQAQTPGAWKMAAPLPRAMGEIVAATATGKIYVLAGLDDENHTPYGTVWEYDPASNRSGR